jgi:hypothetical protein
MLTLNGTLLRPGRLLGGTLLRAELLIESARALPIQLLRGLGKLLLGLQLRLGLAVDCLCSLPLLPLDRLLGLPNFLGSAPQRAV